MKKYLLFLLVSILGLPAVAQTDSGSQSNVTQESINEQIKVINNLEGFVFLSKGEENKREMTDILTRPNQENMIADESAINNMKWDVYPLSDQTIVSIDKEKGTIQGNKYGETILVGNDGKNDHYFLAFVCPDVTVVSPDGAIFKHQKTYNQRMRVDFSQSEKYFINCVILDYEGNQYDITERIAHNPTDNDFDYNGHYISDMNVVGDATFTITMQSIDSDNVYVDPINLDQSPFRVQVYGKKVIFVEDDEKDRFDPANLTVEWKTVNGEYDDDNYAKLEPTEDYVTIRTKDSQNEGIVRKAAELPVELSPGIYFLRIAYGSGSYEDKYKGITYKIVIR